MWNFSDQLACCSKNLQSGPPAVAALDDLQPIAYLKLGQDLLVVPMGCIHKGGCQTFILAEIRLGHALVGFLLQG